MKRNLLLIFAAITLTSCTTAQNEAQMNKKILVTYFSCTGNTKAAAENLAEIFNADLYEIKPVQPYTSTDLDWTDNSSRSTIEMKDKKSRPAIATKVENMDQYDIVFIGFPIWWYVAPTIINTFIESYDLSGKTVVTFATSGGSGIGNCDKHLQETYPKLNWVNGKLFNGRIDANSITDWKKEIINR